MTNDELNQAIAEKVMGWREEHGFWYCGDAMTGRTADAELVASYWNPCWNWAHFGLVLERITLDGNTNWLQMELSEVGTSIGIAPKYRGLHRHGFSPCESRADLLRAACAAILEAWGDA